MSADTTFVVAKRGGNFFAAVVQAAEDLLDPERSVRWEKATHVFLMPKQPKSFTTLEGALGYGVRVHASEEFFVEYEEPMLIEILIDNKDVRRLPV